MDRLKVIFCVAIFFGMSVPSFSVENAQKGNSALNVDGGSAGCKEQFLVYWGTGPSQVERKISEGELGKVPTRVGIDSSGNIYILDSINNRVVNFSSNGAFLRAFPVDSLSKGNSWLSVDRLGNIIIVGEEYGQPNKLRVYSPAGELLSRAAFPASINTVRSFSLLEGKTLFWANESRFDKKTHRSIIQNRLNYELDERYNLVQAKNGSSVRFNEGGLAYSAEITLGNDPIPRAIVFRNSAGGVISKLDAEKLWAVDSYGRIFKLKNIDELSVTDLRGLEIAKIPISGRHSHGGMPVLGNDGNVYQIDLIPNVPEELQRVQTGAPVSDPNYSIDSPGIRVLKCRLAK